MKYLPIVCIFLVLSAVVAVATIADDEKECAEQLGNLAACIPYVSGTAKTPTKECCAATDKVRAANPKCLCVLIKESTDPSLGLPINTTLALQMPDVCEINAKVSDCPALLNLPANSPDAKIFKVANADSSTTTNSPSSDSTASTKSPSSSSTSDTKSTSTVSSNNGTKMASGILFVIMGLASISFFSI